jgi:large conductance mechanosensitive channel
MSNAMQGFVDFIRKQGVVGLAIGFILGGAVSKVVSSVVSDLVNPMLGLALGSAEGLKAAYFSVGGAKVMYGNFLSTVLDFVVITSVIYFGVKMIGLEKLDKKD